MIFASILSLSLALPGTASAAGALPLIVIDPGHGGHDWGATVHGIREKDICLAVAKKLQGQLVAISGLSAQLTRNDDTFLRLDQRVEKTLDSGHAVFVSLHANDARDKRASGMTIYAFGKSGHRWHPGRRLRQLLHLPTPPLEELRASAAFSRSLSRSLRTEGFRVEPAAKAEYYVLKNPEHPSVLIELGYLSNPQDAGRLTDPIYQDKLAQALARGLSRYLTEEAHRPASETIASR